MSPELNFKKSINVIPLINRLKDKNHMNKKNHINAKKKSILHSLTRIWHKSSQKTRTQGEIPQIDKQHL